MQFLILALALLSAFATAQFNLLTNNNVFQKRQGGDAFIPDTTPVDSCQTGWVECGSRDCILPTRGDVCCSEGYGCPGGSFCLTQGFCCPDGEDPATCAQNNGVSIPPDFNTAPVAPSSAPPSTTPASADPLSVGSSAIPTSPAGVAVASSTIAAVSSTIAVQDLSTVVVTAGGTPGYGCSLSTSGTGALNYTVTPTLSTLPQFTGAAAKAQKKFVAVVGGLAGVVALGQL